MNSQRIETKTGMDRQSNFELLRLISMYCIILYHLILFFVEPYSNAIFGEAIQIPLHTGVIVFLLISGYFGIRFSFRGLFTLLFTVVLLWFPLEIARYCVVYTSIKDISLSDILNSLLCISRGPYWFILQYLILYLLSPLINRAIENSQKMHRYALILLGIIVMYGGFVSTETQMINGKNIFLFSFIYVLGRYISIYNIVSFKMGEGIFLLINVLLVIAYCLFGEGLIGKFIFKLFFTYSSPGLIFNSLLLFSFFQKVSFV